MIVFAFVDTRGKIMLVAVECVIFGAVEPIEAWNFQEVGSCVAVTSDIADINCVAKLLADKVSLPVE